jgi:hypothetical protein
MAINENPNKNRIFWLKGQPDSRTLLCDNIYYANKMQVRGRGTDSG